MKLPQILEWILPDNSLKAVVIPFDGAPFPTTLFPSTQLSMNTLGYSTLLTASLFSNELLWLTLLVEGVNVFWTTVKSAVFPIVVNFFLVEAETRRRWDIFQAEVPLY